MKTTGHTSFIALIIFATCFLLVSPSFGQKNKNKKQEKQEIPSTNKKQEGYTTHIRIEKIENGKRNVYEHTYRNGEQPDPEVLSHNPGDSIVSIKITTGIGKDSTYLLEPGNNMSLSFGDDFANHYNFSYYQDMDSLLQGTQQMMLELNHKLLPNIDSLVNHCLDASGFIMGDMQQQLHLGLDSLLNGQNFNFYWNNDGFGLSGNEMNMTLEKDLYNIEEIEKNGKKMIKITPKTKEEKEAKDKKKN